MPRTAMTVEGQTPPQGACNEAKMPTRQGQQRWHNTSNNNSSTMLARTPAQCGQNASATPANASAVPAGPWKANLATTLAQRWQQGQLDPSNDASAMRARTPAQRQKNTIAALARLSKAKLLWAEAGYSNEATGDDNERNNDASLTTCCNSVMIGWVPVYDAGGNTGVPRAAMPAWQGQRRPCNKGDDAGATPATTMAQCWHDASACRNCVVTRQTQVCNAGSNAKMTRATMPAQQGQKRPCNKGNNPGAMPATRTTVRCWQ
jgi:hypothetical protein